MILQEFLKGEGWKQLSPNEFRTRTHRIVYCGKDVYDFEQYSIEDLRNRTGVLYRGRVLSIAHFQALLTFIRDDYQLTESEIKILKEYGNKKEEPIQQLADRDVEEGT